MTIRANAGLERFTPEQIADLKRTSANDAMSRIIETWLAEEFAGDQTDLVRLLNAAAIKAHTLVDDLVESARAAAK